MRTRPAKPVELHLAEGTFRPGRHAGSQSIAGEQLETIPKPRPSLQQTGKAKWNAICKILKERGLLQERYLDAVEMLCRAFDRHARYQQVLKKTGEFYTTDTGFVGVHPAVTQMAKAREEIRRYLLEFGLTPGSATSVSVPKQAKSKRVPTRDKGPPRA